MSWGRVFETYDISWAEHKKYHKSGREELAFRLKDNRFLGLRDEHNFSTPGKWPSKIGDESERKPELR